MLWRNENKSYYSRHGDGFTLLEVMVAMFLFLMVAAGMAQSFAHHLKRNTDAETRSNAIEAAQSVLDAARLEDPTTLPTTGSVSETIVEGRHTFTVTTTYCATASYCASGNSRHLLVNVSLRGQQQYAVETVFTALK